MKRNDTHGEFATRDGYDGFVGKVAGLLLGLLICIAVVAGSAVAQDVPITPEHTCHYYDPAHLGQGFDLRVLPADGSVPVRVFAALYVGAIPQWYRWHPSWFSVQGQFDEEGDGNSRTLPVYEIHTVFGQGLTPLHERVGQIRLTATGATTLVAEVRLDPEGGFSPAPPPLTLTLNLQCLVR